MRGYWILLLPCLLMGCSPVVVVASLAVNGASYVATGKGVADHGLSAITNEDCATWRVVKGEAVCRPNNDTYPLDVLPVAGGAQPRPPQPTAQIAKAQEPDGKRTPE